MYAYVFVRYHSGDGAGHVGWGFELDDGRVCVGSVENHSGHLFTPAAEMGFWMQCRHDFAEPMLEKKYDDVKTFEVPRGNATDAFRVLQWIEHSAYKAIARNCEDDVYDVLRMYGVKDLEAPFFNWFPRWWFGRLRGERKAVSDLRQPQAPSIDLRTDALAAHQPIPQDDRDVEPLRPAWRRPLHVQHHLLNVMKLRPRLPARRQTRRSPQATAREH